MADGLTLETALPPDGIAAVEALGPVEGLVIVAALNQARTAPAVVTAVAAGLARVFAGRKTAVLFVDGGSQDGTFEAVDGRASAGAPVPVASARISGRPGRGRAVLGGARGRPPRRRPRGGTRRCRPRQLRRRLGRAAARPVLAGMPTTSRPLHPGAERGNAHDESSRAAGPIALRQAAPGGARGMRRRLPGPPRRVAAGRRMGRRADRPGRGTAGPRPGAGRRLRLRRGSPGPEGGRSWDCSRRSRPHPGGLRGTAVPVDGAPRRGVAGRPRKRARGAAGPSVPPRG